MCADTLFKKQDDLKHKTEILQKIRSELEVKRPKVQKLEAESTATETKINKLDQSIVCKERQIFRAFSKKHDIKDLRAYYRDRTARQHQLSAEDAALKEKKRELRSLDSRVCKASE